MMPGPPSESSEEGENKVTYPPKTINYDVDYSTAPAKGTGVFIKGGFADYDYDAISPHGIPRKNRKKGK